MIGLVEERLVPVKELDDVGKRHEFFPRKYAEQNFLELLFLSYNFFVVVVVPIMRHFV